jgi:hypothetical protein
MVIMKRYFACLAVVLAGCSSPAETEEVTEQDVPQAPVPTPPSSNSPHASSCDRPTQYESITVDGRTYSLPIFVMCDPNVSERDLGDPPPDVAANPYWKVIAPVQAKR